MSKTIEKAELIDYVLTQYSIFCTKCTNTHFASEACLDEFDANDEFYSLGWRIKNSDCLCPNCVGKN